MTRYLIELVDGKGSIMFSREVILAKCRYAV